MEDDGHSVQVYDVLDLMGWAVTVVGQDILGSNTDNTY